MKIQKELDETKIVLHKTIESVLERGEKIDSLVEKSDGLSAQSKMFYSMEPLPCVVHGVGSVLISILYRTSKATEFVLRNHVTLLRASWERAGLQYCLQAIHESRHNYAIITN